MEIKKDARKHESYSKTLRGEEHPDVLCPDYPCSKELADLLEHSKVLADESGFLHIEPEHLLSALLSAQSDIRGHRAVLGHFFERRFQVVALQRDIDASLKKKLASPSSKSTGMPKESAHIIDGIASEAKELGQEEADSTHLLLSLIQSKSAARDILERYGVTYSSALDFITGKKADDEIGRPTSRDQATWDQSSQSSPSVPYPAPPSVAMPLAARLHSDLWTLEDRLGYSLYAKSIVEFLLHRNTSPPLTVGILAPWGQGKTTLMQLIRDEVRKKHPEKTKKGGTNVKTTLAQLLNLLESSVFPLKKLKYPTVWFNAWKYQSCEQLWAGLAHAIISQLVDKLPNQLDKERFWLQLQLKRIDVEEVRKDVHRVISESVLPAVVGFAALGALAIVMLLSATFVSGPSVTVLLYGGEFSAAVSFFGGAWKWISERKKSLAKTLDGKFDKYVRQPEYEAKMGFFYQMEEDLRKVFELLVEKEAPLIVFVDDVDRCTPGKAAELIEAINMFLSGDFPQCYFVVGMDAQVVATSLDVANDKLSERLRHLSGSMGWCFMEKFIQFPFMIPNLSENQQAKFIETLFGDLRQRVEDINVEKITEELNLDLARPDMNLMPGVDRADKLKKLFAANADGFREMSSKFLEKGALQFSDQDESLKVELLQHTKYLENSPRTFKRFANLFRFYRFYEWSRELQGLPTATAQELGMWVTLMLRWPEVVRLVQWKASTEGIKGLSPTMKASMLDVAAREAQDHAQWKEKLKSQNLQEAIPLEDAGLFHFLNENVGRGLSIERAVEAGIW